MKSKSKIVLTGAVAGAMAMGAVTSVILPASSAHAENASGISSTTTTNNDARGGVLASSSTSATTNTGGATAGADTDTRMRQAESRQSGSRGSLLDNNSSADIDTDANVNGVGADSALSVDTDSRFRNTESRISGSGGETATDGGSVAIDTTLDATDPDDATDADTNAAAEEQVDTDARMRDAESRMSGSRGSLQSDTTAGADPNAALRAQIRDTTTDAKVGISTETGAAADDHGTDTAAEVETSTGTQIGAGGELQR